MKVRLRRSVAGLIEVYRLHEYRSAERVLDEIIRQYGFFRFEVISSERMEKAAVFQRKFKWQKPLEIYQIADDLTVIIQEYARFSQIPLEQAVEDIVCQWLCLGYGDLI